MRPPSSKTNAAHPAKVLLIAPRWGHVYGQYKSLSRRFNFHPPLGLCYLAASLKQAGYEAKVMDMEAGGLAGGDILSELDNGGYSYVGISSTTPIYASAVETAKEIKSRFEIPVILGGPHATIVRREALHESGCFDYIVCGEGEGTLVSLIGRLSARVDDPDIPGLIYSRNCVITDTGMAEREMNLDLLPFPDRSDFNPDGYLWSVPGRGLVPTTSIMFSRGCPFECAFCSQDIMYSRKVRFRSVQNIKSELEKLIAETAYRHFVILDDTLTWNRSKITEILEMIIENKFKITFEGETRANLLDDELVAMLKRAGLVRMNIGIESGDPEILKIIKAGIKTEDIKRALSLLKKHGVETRGSVLIGCPYETKEKVLKTINFISGLKDLDQPYINIAMPYPGTRLREMALSGEGGARLIKKDYSDLMRYGHSVMEVNDMDMDTIVKLQSFGLRRAYMRPRRLFYNLRRAGLKAGIRNALAFLRSLTGI